MDQTQQPPDPTCGNQTEGQAPPSAEFAADLAGDLAHAYDWLPVLDLEAGMVVARPVVGMHGSRATLHLAAGSVITADTVAQLVNKGVECVAVVAVTTTDPGAEAGCRQRYEARLDEIFGPTPNDDCRVLLDALKMLGAPRC